MLLDIKTELADKELSMHSVQDALSCLDKKDIPMEQYLNLPQNHALTPYFIEFYLTTTHSLFRLWLQRDKDLPSEEFIKLAENLYSRGVSAYTDEGF
ncbi:hypothetical protein [Paenibacillus silagei]|uniref:hypothetical protein n=1 Tax=Paenibacillus silagei TaxID=1670801 RepID=UPI001FD962FF|nr:hypothetical protein [Paenibacillus silagei]